MTQNQSNNWKIAAIILVGTVLVLSVSLGILAYQQTIHASGTITPVKTVGCAVYADGAGAQSLTSINWGTLPPDSAVNVTVWVKNTGNTPVNYTVTTANWNPIGAYNYISLTADLKGITNATVGSIIPIILTDSINASAPTVSYSYDITITASG
jgi:hypothetical protein